MHKMVEIKTDRIDDSMQLNILEIKILRADSENILRKCPITQYLKITFVTVFRGNCPFYHNCAYI